LGKKKEEKKFVKKRFFTSNLSGKVPTTLRKIPSEVIPLEKPPNFTFNPVKPLTLSPSSPLSEGFSLIFLLLGRTFCKK
jgi:hypothetical protein